MSLFSTINRKRRLTDLGSDRGKTSHQSVVLKVLFNVYSKCLLSSDVVDKIDG